MGKGAWQGDDRRSRTVCAHTAVCAARRGPCLLERRLATRRVWRETLREGEEAKAPEAQRCSARWQGAWRARPKLGGGTYWHTVSVAKRAALFCALSSSYAESYTRVLYRRLAYGSEILRPVRVCRDMTLSLDSVRVQWGQRCIWSRVLRRNNTVTVTVAFFFSKRSKKLRGSPCDSSHELQHRW